MYFSQSVSLSVCLSVCLYKVHAHAIHILVGGRLTPISSALQYCLSFEVKIRSTDVLMPQWWSKLHETQCIRCITMHTWPQLLYSHACTHTRQGTNSRSVAINASWALLSSIRSAFKVKSSSLWTTYFSLDLGLPKTAVKVSKLCHNSRTKP